MFIDIYIYTHNLFFPGNGTNIFLALADRMSMIIIFGVIKVIK